MNRIEKLIKEKCPDGVRRVRLGEVCNIKTGKGITKSDASADGVYPIISGGIEPMGYYKEFNREANTVTVSRVGANAGIVLFNTRKFYLNDKCFSVIPIIEHSIIAKFLYYYLHYKESSIKDLQSEGGVPTINTQKLGSIIIPLPPLSIQQEIVKILDSFTALQQNLEDELKLRQKQYEHYREKLLTFEDGEVEWKKIGEIFVFKNGLNKGKEYFGHGGPIINYTDVYHNIGITKEIPKGTVQLTNSEIERFSVKKGDVFFTRTSETSEEVGIASVLLEDIENCTFSGFLLRARPIDESFIPEYCKYCFSSYGMRNKIINSSSCTTRATTTGTILSSLTIPVPNKATQLQITQTLDHFESLISNIKTEIELRKKQYEYYREKLLTF